MSNQCVIFIANRAYALSNSRLEIIKHFLSHQWQVVLATSEDEESRSICELGAEIEPIHFHRGGASFASDYRAYRHLKKIFQKWSPTLIHNFHAKPVILGSLAASTCKAHKPCVINTITGLGHAFVMGGLPARIAGWGYKKALPCADCTIFQNRDDLKLFLNNGWVSKENTRFIAGSGVDISRFSCDPQTDVSRFSCEPRKDASRFSCEPRKDASRSFCESRTSGSQQHAPTVVMMGRLLKQKGIAEFAEVAKRIQQQSPEARFILAGEEDPIHPDAIDRTWLDAQTHIEFVGRLQDVVPLLRDSDLLLFPSYREGVPRVVLEAAAMGLPTVAFDVPGVREAVIDGETGFLVPHLDVDALTEKVSLLLRDGSLLRDMGVAARVMVENQFDIHSIQDQYFDVYRSLGMSV